MLLWAWSVWGCCFSMWKLSSCPRSCHSHDKLWNVPFSWENQYSHDNVDSHENSHGNSHGNSHVVWKFSWEFLWEFPLVFENSHGSWHCYFLMTQNKGFRNLLQLVVFTPSHIRVCCILHRTTYIPLSSCTVFCESHLAFSLIFSWANLRFSLGGVVDVSNSSVIRAHIRTTHCRLYLVASLVYSMNLINPVMGHLKLHTE